MSVGTLEELHDVDALKGLYSAEKQIVQALPKLAKAAKSLELKDALLSHLEKPRDRLSVSKRLVIAKDVNRIARKVAWS